MGFIDDKRAVSELPIKPRRTKGTYSYKFRNYFAGGVLAFGVLFGAAFMIFPPTDKLRQFAVQNFFGENEEIKNRKYSMPLVGSQHNSYAVRRLMRAHEGLEEEDLSVTIETLKSEIKQRQNLQKEK